MDYLPVGCFGKAPCEGDYLTHDVSSAAARMLRHWLREGFKGARLTEDGSESDFAEGPGRRLLIAPADANRWLAGVVGPSEDSHPRKNVFAVFVHLPKRLYAKSYHLLPLALAPIWASLEDTREQLLEVLSRDSFFDMLTGSRVPPPITPAEAKIEYERHTAGDPCEMLECGNGGMLDRLSQGLADMVKKSGNSSREPIAACLPVSRDRATGAADCSFWIDLINRQFWWKSFQPAVFLSRGIGDQPPSVVLVYGSLDPDFYPGIIGDRPNPNILVPLPSPVASGRESTTGDSQPSGSYQDLLKRKYRG